MEEKTGCKVKGLLYIVAGSLIVLLTLTVVGLWTTNRVMVSQHQQLQQQKNNQEMAVQRFLGELKGAKTYKDMKEVVDKVQ